MRCFDEGFLISRGYLYNACIYLFCYNITESYGMLCVYTCPRGY